MDDYDADLNDKDSFELVEIEEGIEVEIGKREKKRRVQFD